MRRTGSRPGWSPRTANREEYQKKKVLRNVTPSCSYSSSWKVFCWLQSLLCIWPTYQTWWELWWKFPSERLCPFSECRVSFVPFKTRVKSLWEEDPSGYLSKSAGSINLPLSQFSFEDFLKGARRREQSLSWWLDLLCPWCRCSHLWGLRTLLSAQIVTASLHRFYFIPPNLCHACSLRKQATDLTKASVSTLLNNCWERDNICEK